jgi:hypothetical protein
MGITVRNLLVSWASSNQIHRQIRQMNSDTGESNDGSGGEYGRIWEDSMKMAIHADDPCQATKCSGRCQESHEGCEELALGV